MQVNNSTAFGHQARRQAVLRDEMEHAYCGLFIDRLLYKAAAPYWLDNPSLLDEELDLIHEELFSYSRPDHWALVKLFGLAPKAPTVFAVRRALRPLVPIDNAYWSRRIELRAAKRREKEQAEAAQTADPMEDSDEACETDEEAARESATAPFFD